MMKSIQKKSEKATLVCCFVLLCLHLLLYAKPAPAQPPVPPPEKVLVSLSFSTLDDKAPDWKWLRAQSADGRILKMLQPVKSKIDGIVVPIFDNGRCFYPTSVAPFKGRNPSAKEDEQALRDLLAAGRKAGIPIYVGLDMLAWQKSGFDQKTGIFKEVPNYQELNKDYGRSPQPEALYASPFNEEVRTVLLSLMTEISGKFPEASGVVLDLHLSSREMLGFSEAARAASMIDVGIDPVDLSLTEAVVEGKTNRLQRYVQWRRDVMTSFLKSLAVAYRSKKEEGRVLVSGSADYYVQRDLNDRRMVQDWRHWNDVGLVNAVLLEGRWLSRYSSTDQFVEFLNPAHGAVKKEAQPSSLIPTTTGDFLVKDSNYQRDWAILKSRVPALGQFAAIAYSDDDIKDIVALAQGRAVLSQLPAPKVGEIAPNFTLNDSAGKAWSSREARWKNALAVLFMEDIATPLLQTIDAASQALRSKGTEPVVISKQSLQLVEASIPVLVDNAQSLTPFFSSTPNLAIIDKAGFIRSQARIESSAALVTALEKVSDPTPALRIGSPAPDFIVEDMDGNKVNLAALRGHKNMLLTFFPKCFTSGCAGHLGSLGDSKAMFDKNDTEIFAVSVDPADVQIAFAQSLGITFPLIPDTGRNLCILYDAVSNIPGNSTVLSSRQSVLIDKAGIVRLIDKRVNISTHGHDILEKMRELGLAK